MNTYILRYTPEKDVYFDNNSPMFPDVFREKIDKLAGKNITKHAPPLGGFFGSFINTFVVKAEFADEFFKQILPKIGYKEENGGLVVWDKDEETMANEI